MKYRTGFVSNSSNSSFIVEKKWFNEMQLSEVADVEYIVDLWQKRGDKDLGELGCLDKEWIRDWNVSEENDLVCFSCGMNNFCMATYLEMIGISNDKIVYR